MYIQISDYFLAFFQELLVHQFQIDYILIRLLNLIIYKKLTQVKSKLFEKYNK